MRPSFPCHNVASKERNSASERWCHVGENRTACSYCGVGCGIEVTTKADQVTGLPVIAQVGGTSCTRRT